ncbi:MAG: glucose 1-dehydrogenase [Gammaproteobacteria bacterium]|nr:glucose 1-dehydrogenase [Gammaproteobacteria bacterium]
MSGRLDGKVAVITGGASGMGAATVRKFVAEGARVVIADVQEEKGRELAQDIGPDAVFAFADVCREADVQGMIETAAAEFGGLDCLFNNAGFGGVTGDIETTDMGEPYERTVGAMLTGVVLGMKHAAPHLKARGGGAIISTASVAGIKGGLGPHVYSGVKAAVVNLSRSVAMELGPFSIRVNAICPGGIATPIFAGQLAQSGGNEDYAAAVRPFLQQMQPVPRAGEPEDIANAACFLASDEASFITGQALVVDGGLTAGNWVPPGETSTLDAMAEAFGVDDAADMDMVVHDPRDGQNR